MTEEVNMQSSWKMRFVAVLGIVVAVELVWAVVTYVKNTIGKPDQLAFRLCIAREPKLCPNDASFVQDAGEDTLTRWAQRECSSYKARRIIINDSAPKDCNCYFADVTCSSE
jgi:hypothetical protein